MLLCGICLAVPVGGKHTPGTQPSAAQHGLLPGSVLFREGALDIEMAAAELQGGEPSVIQGHCLLHVGDALT